MRLSQLLVMALAPLLGVASAAAEGQLRRVPYNHPGLVVDLGVGLWAWPLPMDYDGDGDHDLVIVCEGKPYGGTYFFENPSTSGEPMPVFRRAVRIGEAKKNAQVSFVGGQSRVLVPGYEAVGFHETGFGELRSLNVPRPVHVAKGRIRGDQWRYVDFDGDGLLDIVVGVGDWTEYHTNPGFDAEGRWTGGPGHGYVYLLRNVGDATTPRYDMPQKVEAGGEPIDMEGMPSPNFADFDGDGDLDLLCGEFVDRLTYFENVGSRTQPRYARGRFIRVNGEELTFDLCMIVPVAIDWDRDGDVDLVVGQEDGRVLFVEHTGAVIDGMPAFALPRYFQQEADDLKFGALATPVSVDWDADGDEDLVCGNTAGEVAFIENLDGAASPRWAAPKLLEAGGEVIRIQAGINGSIQGPIERKWGYTQPSVGDLNGDGLNDLVLNSIWGRVVWCRNVGSAGAPKLGAAQPVEVLWPGQPPKPAWTWWEPGPREFATQWRSSAIVIDLTRDGISDLVTLDHEGFLAVLEGSRNASGPLLLPPRRVFRSLGPSGFDERHRVTRNTPGVLQFNTEVAGKSGRRTFCFDDLDHDGDYDMIVNSVNGNVFRNTSGDGEGVAFEDLGPLAADVLAGHSTSPTTVDWDRDGIHDILLGAEDGFFYLAPNPLQQHKTTGETP